MQMSQRRSRFLAGVYSGALASAFALALTAGPSFAQSASPAPAPMTPSAAGSGAAVDTTSQRPANGATAQQFVQKAAMGNQFEIETSELGVQRAKSPELKAFAQQMITDHKKAGDELKATLKKSNAVGDLTTGAVYDEKHRKAFEKLKAASAAEFDRTYAEIQLDAHRETVALFKTYAASGDDPQLKMFAKDTLPVLEMHLQHIEKIKAGA